MTWRGRRLWGEGEGEVVVKGWKGWFEEERGGGAAAAVAAPAAAALLLAMSADRNYSHNTLGKTFMN